MTTEHKYAHVLRWIADGSRIQHEFRDEWRECCNQRLLQMMADGNIERDPRKFRLAPRTIMIGDVECEAPITEPTKDAWVITTAGDISELAAFSDGYALKIIDAGFAYATKEAATAARDATRKLLTGNQN